MCEAYVSFRGNSLIVESSDFTFYNSRVFDRLNKFWPNKKYSYLFNLSRTLKLLKIKLSTINEFSQNETPASYARLRYIAITHFVSRDSSRATHVGNAIACRFAGRFYFRVNEILRCVLRCQSVCDCLAGLVEMNSYSLWDTHIHRHTVETWNETRSRWFFHQEVSMRVARQKLETADRSAATRPDTPCLEFPAW